MTPVTVGELNTEVAAEQPTSGADAGAGPPPPTPWDELERLRQAAAELAGLRARTRAKDFDA